MRLEKLKRDVSEPLKEKYLFLLYVLSIMDRALMETEHCIRKTDFRGYLHWAKKTTAKPKYEATEQIVTAIAELEKVYEDICGITQSLALEIVKNNNMYGENMDTIIKALIACYDQVQVYTIMKTHDNVLPYTYWKEDYEKIEEKIFKFPELFIPTAYQKAHMDLYLAIDVLEPWDDMEISDAKDILEDAEGRAEVALAFLTSKECLPDALVENTIRFLSLFLEAIVKYRKEIGCKNEKEADM